MREMNYGRGHSSITPRQRQARGEATENLLKPIGQDGDSDGKQEKNTISPYGSGTVIRRHDLGRYWDSLLVEFAEAEAGLYPCPN